MGDVIRITNEADLTLIKLKHEAFIKYGKKVFKNHLNDWIISQYPKTANFETEFVNWLNKK